MRGCNICLLALLLLSVAVCFGQYPVSLPTKDEQTDTVTVDSISTDTTAQVEPTKEENTEEEFVGTSPSALKAEALMWVRRLVYRGYFDDETTGVTAVYALTAWKEASGPYGPVLGHVSVTYLGSVSWLGNSAAWIQATYKSFEPGRPSVDFDLIMERGEKLGKAYRALWRMNKEELTSANFNIQEGQYDIDRDDQPRSGDETELKLFSGTYPVTVYRGSGADGAKVVAYRGRDIPPLNLVRLGYGTHCLNLRDRANDVEPKFSVPLPTSR